MCHSQGFYPGKLYKFSEYHMIVKTQRTFIYYFGLVAVFSAADSVPLLMS